MARTKKTAEEVEVKEEKVTEAPKKAKKADKKEAQAKPALLYEEFKKAVNI